MTTCGGCYKLRSYSNLSDHDFEYLVADLLWAHLELKFEVFARGPDKGIDLRRIRTDGTVDIAQCKHMYKSSFSQLVAAARGGKLSLDNLDVQVASYRFVTSRELTAKNKRDIATVLAPYLVDDDAIWSANDLELLLNRYNQVERSHPKIWLSGTEQLSATVHSNIWNRSRQLIGEIERTAPVYVTTPTLAAARKKLHDEKVLIISGPPGIGKSTLARMLVADAVKQGYEPVLISRDIDEAYAILDLDRQQVFYYDDFLGSVFLEERLPKNEDKRLVSFMDYCRRCESSLFVLTTREYILRQAIQRYEEFGRVNLGARRATIQLNDYTKLERARIFYNHIWHSPLITPDAKRSVSTPSQYGPIISHEYYNPRVIEFVTGLSGCKLDPNELNDLGAAALNALNDPRHIWRYAFERQLDRACRDVLICLASLPNPATEADLNEAFERQAESVNSEHVAAEFYDALKTLSDSFIKVAGLTEHAQLSFLNPSIRDFISLWLIEHEAEARSAISGARFFEQLEWLSDKVVEQCVGDRCERLRGCIASVVPRLWYSHGTHVPRSAGGRIGPTPSRGHALLLLERLLLVSRLVDQTAIYADTLGPWLLKRAVEAESVLYETPQSLTATCQIVLALHRNGLGGPRCVERAYRAVATHAQTAAEWNLLLKLDAGAPNAIPQDLREECSTAAQAWMDEEIQSNGLNLYDMQDLLDLCRLANAIGVEIDKTSYTQLIYALEQRRSSEEEVGSKSLNRPGGIANERQEDLLIEALFSRLAAS